MKYNGQMKGKILSILVMSLLLSTVLPPIFNSSDGSSSIVEDTDSIGVNKRYSYSMTYNSVSKSITVDGMDSVTKNNDNTFNPGSWTWDESGYGPFNSFYAAFDSKTGKMICHLDPYNLQSSVDGKQSLKGIDCNIMWVLPVVYWKVSNSGNNSTVTLTNDPFAGGTAYAHIVDGVLRNYLAIGVYEGSDNGGALASKTNQKVLQGGTMVQYSNLAASAKVDSGTPMIWNYYQYQLYKLCSIMVVGTFDVQNAIGYGDANSGNDNMTQSTGQLDNKGPYYGYGPNSVGSEKLFIENVWCSAWDLLYGATVYLNTLYISDNSAIDYSIVGSGSGLTRYFKSTNIGVASTNYINRSGWIDAISSNEVTWGTSTSGSSSKGVIGDYAYSVHHQGSLMAVGGDSNYGDKAGILAHDFSYYYWQPSNTTSYNVRLAFVFDYDPCSGYWSYILHNENEGGIMKTSNIDVIKASNGTTELMKGLRDSSSISWSFDQNGYGPFDSFYAAFELDEKNNLRMVCHLDPNDFSKTPTGKETHYREMNYSIMWVLPTIYWYSSGSSLVLTNSPYVGSAYAHTIDGKIYNYLAIGVYEASYNSKNSAMASFSNNDKLVTNRTVTELRQLANNISLDSTLGGINNQMIWNYYQWQLFRLCGLSVVGDFDSQKYVGNGSSQSGVSTGVTDGCKSYYTKSGNSDSVKLFIENSWGSLNEYVDDISLIFTNNSYFKAGQNSRPDGNNQYSVFSIPTNEGFYPGMITLSSTGWGIGCATKPGNLYSDKIMASKSSGEGYYFLSGGDSTNNFEVTDIGINYFDYSKNSTANQTIGTRVSFVFNNDTSTVQTESEGSKTYKWEIESISTDRTTLQIYDISSGYIFNGNAPWISLKDNIESIVCNVSIELADNAFDGYTNLRNASFTCSKIGAGAFKNTGFTSINASEGDTLSLKITNNTVPKDCFNGCTSLETVDFSSYKGSVTNIEEGAFSKCTSLKSITISDNCAIKNNAFLNSGDSDGFTVNGKITGVGDSAFENSTIKCIDLSSCTGIGSAAFKDCSDLKEVSLPAISTLPLNAFAGSSIEKIVANSCESIGISSFDGCDSLQTVNMAGLSSIGNYAFRGCSSLGSITTGIGVKIGDEAFKDCSNDNETFIGNLQTIISNATEIGINALENTKIKSISNNSVKMIGGYAFLNCTNLETVKLKASSDAEETVIGDYAFSGCQNLNDVQLEGMEEGLGIGVFYYCSGLTKFSSQDMDYIPVSTFTGCTGLTEVYISKNIQKIEAEAFMDCTSLATVSFKSANRTLGAEEAEIAYSINLGDLLYIGKSAFQNTGIQSISIGKVQTIDENAFKDSKNLTIFRAKSVDTVKTSAFDGCSALYHWLDNAEESGDTYNNPNQSKGLYLLKATSVGDYAFRGTQFTSLITLSLESCGVEAFSNNHNLGSVVIECNDVLTELPAGSFQNCSALTEVHLPDSIVKIGTDAIDNRSGIRVYSNSPSLDYSGTYTVLSMNTSGTVKGELFFESNGQRIMINGSKTVIPYIDGRKVSFFFVITVDEENYVQLKAGNSGEVLTAVMDNCSEYEGYKQLSFMTEQSGSEKSMVVKSVSETGEQSLEKTVTISNYGDSITLPSSVDSKYTNYRGFVSGVEFDQGKKVIMNFYEEQFVLQTRAENVTIKWDYGEYGGLEPIRSQTVPKNSSVSLPVDYILMEEQKTYLEYKGWYPSKGTGSMPLSDGFKAISNATYYLRVDYKDTTIDVKFDGQLVNEFKLSGKVNVIVDGPLIKCTDSKDKTEQYNVSEYCTERGMSFVQFMKNESTVFDGDPSVTGKLTLHIYYEPIEYSIKLKFNIDDDRTIGKVLIGGREYNNGDVWKDTISVAELTSGELVFPDVKCSSHAFKQSYFEHRSGVGPYHSGSFIVSLEELKNESSEDNISTLVLDFESGKYTINLNTGFKGLVCDTIVVTEGDATILSQLPKTFIKNDFSLGWTFQYWTFGDGENKKKVSDALTDGHLSQEMVDQGNENFRVITFNAEWVETPYKLVLNHETDGWICTWTQEQLDAIGTIKIGQQLNLPQYADMKKEHMEFQGWVLKNGDTIISGEVSRDILSKATTNNVVNLYVKSSNRIYDVKLDYNGGWLTEGEWRGSIEFGTKFTLPNNEDIVVSNDYHKLEGWLLQKGDHSKKPNSGDELTLDSELASYATDDGYTITIKAVWDLLDYYIEYTCIDEGAIKISNPQKHDEPYRVGSSFSVDPHTFTAGSTTKTYYELKGYTQIGWTFKIGSNTPLTENYDTFTEDMASYASKAKVYLYPVWKPQSYTIEYVLNGGSLGMYSPTAGYYGTELEISNPTKSASRFTGWTATGVNSDCSQYKVGSVFSPWDGTSLAKTTQYLNLTDVEGGKIVFTANWESAIFGLLFDLNGGAGEVDGGDVSGVIGGDIKLASASKVTKSGYVFAGWSINGVTPIGKSGETVKLTDIMASSADSNNIITFKAVWSTIQYTIEFRINDSDPYMKITAYYDVSTPLGIPERTGYVFNGWTSSNLGSKNALFSLNGDVWYSWADGKSPANGAYVMNLTEKSGDSIKLTASWTPQNYKISYNSNGGTGKAPIDDTIYKVGDKLSMKPYEVLDGTYGSKIIRGWALERNATSPLTFDEFSVSLAEVANSVYTVTFYAVWVDGMCNVSVDLNGSKIDDIPSGWSQQSDGIYTISIAFGTDVKSLLTDWPNPYLDGHVFKKWNYALNTVTENMVITPEFEEVKQEIVYYIAGGAVGVIALLALISRFEWL